MALYPKVLVSLSLFASCLFVPAGLSAQGSRSEQVQIKPPLLSTIDPPAPDATAADLEKRADDLHVQKLYFDALDYYRAALGKATTPADHAKILNKICRTQLVMTRLA